MKVTRNSNTMTLEVTFQNAISDADITWEMMQQIKFYKETAIAEGFKYPAFLDGEYSFSYKIDAVSLMQYYVNSGILSLAGLEKLTGINQKQLWGYINGTKPRKAQEERIESGFRALDKDLNAIFA